MSYFKPSYISEGYFPACTEYFTTGYIAQEYYANCCEEYLKIGYFSSKYFTGCDVCDGYYRPGYVASGYYEACACPQYIQEGYIATGYYFNCENNTKQGNITINAQAVVQSTGVLNGQLNITSFADLELDFAVFKYQTYTLATQSSVEGITSKNALLDIQANSTMDLKEDTFKSINILCESKLYLNKSEIHDLVIDNFASLTMVVSKDVHEDLIPVINHLYECCNDLQRRVEYLEATTLTAQDIEPLYSTKEVLFDVQRPGNC